MKKVKDSQKRWKQLVTMLLVAALLVTGTPDVVGFASEGTQEQCFLKPHPRTVLRHQGAASRETTAPAQGLRQNAACQVMCSGSTGSK